MKAHFLATTDLESIAIAVGRFAACADHNRYYSMTEIVAEIYAVDYATEEFWRVAPGVGESLRANGFKQVAYKGRRFWVRGSGASSGQGQSNV